MKVGDTVWLFDENRRVYAPRKEGQGLSSGPPIFREHFVPHEIVGETIRTWLVGKGTLENVRKKDLTYRHWNGGRVRIFTSEQEVDDACYVHDTRHKIGRAVERCRDAVLLKQIAALVGVAEGSEGE